MANDEAASQGGAPFPAKAVNDLDGTYNGSVEGVQIFGPTPPVTAPSRALAMTSKDSIAPSLLALG
jgi:hypothetical protein